MSIWLLGHQIQSGQTGLDRVGLGWTGLDQVEKENHFEIV